MPTARPEKCPYGIITIGGFRQGLGLFDLNERLCQRFDSRRKVRIFPRAWNCDPDTLAEEVRRAHDQLASLILVCFSWGLPTGMQFAREISRSGHKIARLISADGVNRIPDWPRMGLPFGRVRIPQNVREVVRLYQQNEKGLMRVVNSQPPIIENRQKTILVQEIPVESSHVYLDDHPAFTNAVEASIVSVWPSLVMDEMRWGQAA